MSEMPQNFLMILKYLYECTYKVSRPYKMFNLFDMAIMLEKISQDLWRGCQGNHLPII